MSNIPSQFSPAGLSSRQSAMSDAQFSSYVQQRSISAEESLNAGLTIQTKEGDIVTLSANSYAKLDAYSYNSKGVVQTEDGRAVVKQNYREMTLASGESFSFSVIGDLSEEELEDIEAIVEDIDEIIDEMAQGDMDDAVALALGMGGYESVSAFSADISYERSYSRTVQTEAARGELSGPEAVAEDDSDLITQSNALPQPEKPIKPMEPFPENTRPLRRKKLELDNVPSLMEKLAERLEEIEEDRLENAKGPVDQLFAHHMERAKDDDDDDDNGGPAFNALNEARKQVERLIEQLTSDAFGRHLSDFMDS